MNKFTEYKNKITTYLDKHPGVKKGLKIGFALLGTGVSAYAGYKIGTSGSKKDEVPLIPEKDDYDKLVEKLGTPDFQKAFEEQCQKDYKDALIKDAISQVVDDHTFDMTFIDNKTGQKVIIPESAMGSYVKDMIEGCGDYKDVLIENPAENVCKVYPAVEIAETTADIVE